MIPPERPTFTATLLPQRSLSRKGFIALMLALAFASAVSGILFLIVGAWPVTGFLGLDVLLVYLAFRLNYRAARLSETVDLREGQLTVTRRYPSGRREEWLFNPYWVRFSVERHADVAPKLILTSHGRSVILGDFLSADAKNAFAASFSKALNAHR
jgi:uncharacterized membrane protein